MNKKKLRRSLAVLSAAGLAVLSMGMLAGCDTKRPEITITYTFNGKDYAVDYTLSRDATPQTVRHFIELADAGYYDNKDFCVHDYDGTYLRTGAYMLDEEGDLEEYDYFAEVKRLEAEEGVEFTQSVYLTDLSKSDKKGDALYTVYGEMSGQYTYTGTRYSHSQGALVMYYPSKGAFTGTVTVERNDGGDNNNGDKYQANTRYDYNSATATFYTFLGTSNYNADQNYCVFGKASNYEEQMTNGLLKAIADYQAEHSEEEDYSFTVELVKRMNTLDHLSAAYSVNVRNFFELIRKADVDETYNTPVDMPIYLKSVKVNKY